MNTDGNYGQSSGINTCIYPYPEIPYYPNVNPVPNLPYVIQYVTNNSTYYPYQIRKVQNGFILSKNGSEFVFTEIKELVKFLEKELKI